MPAPGTTPPKFNTDAHDEIEVRRALPVYDRPAWLEGKRTFIGLAISAAGLLGSRFHVDVPTEEVNGVLDVVAMNWDVFAQITGLVVAAWGRIKASQRFKKEVAAIKSPPANVKLGN